MTVEIVPIRMEHIESYHHAVDLVSRERRFLAFLEAPPIESTRKFVGNNIAKGFPQMVALSAGEIVGWCDVMPSLRPTLAHTGVLGMGLVRLYRSQGHGTGLLRATLAAAWRIGLTRVELTVREHNISAIALYRKFGFQTEGVKRNAIRLDGRYENLVIMALLNQATED